MASDAPGAPRDPRGGLGGLASPGLASPGALADATGGVDQGGTGVDKAHGGQGDDQGGGRVGGQGGGRVGATKVKARGRKRDPDGRGAPNPPKRAKSDESALADALRRLDSPGDVTQAYAELRATSDATRVLSDAYHGPGQAHGLAFSIKDGADCKFPPSLRRIIRECQEDVGAKPPPAGTGDLSKWAERGVLLLNTTLTVLQGDANSHAEKGWETFTDAVVRCVNQRPGKGVVFLLLGLVARAKCASVNRGKHAVLEIAHPANYGKAKVPFPGSACFSRANGLLVDVLGYASGVDWSLLAGDGPCDATVSLRAGGADGDGDGDGRAGGQPGGQPGLLAKPAKAGGGPKPRRAARKPTPAELAELADEGERVPEDERVAFDETLLDSIRAYVEPAPDNKARAPAGAPSAMTARAQTWASSPGFGGAVSGRETVFADVMQHVLWAAARAVRGAGKPIHLAEAEASSLLAAASVDLEPEPNVARELADNAYAAALAVATFAGAPRASSKALTVQWRRAPHHAEPTLVWGLAKVEAARHLGDACLPCVPRDAVRIVSFPHLACPICDQTFSSLGEVFDATAGQLHEGICPAGLPPKTPVGVYRLRWIHPK